MTVIRKVPRLDRPGLYKKASAQLYVVQPVPGRDWMASYTPWSVRLRRARANERGWYGFIPAVRAGWQRVDDAPEPLPPPETRKADHLPAPPYSGPNRLMGPWELGNPPETWAEVQWPDWVPETIRAQLRGRGMHRGPRDYASTSGYQVPADFGARCRYVGPVAAVAFDGCGGSTRPAEPVIGRYVHAWNNVGRLVCPEGIVYVGDYAVQSLDPPVAPPPDGVVLLADWRAEALDRFGSWEQVVFVCPVCGHHASVAEYRAAPGKPRGAGFNCIGRYTPGVGCDYTGGGLFQLNPVSVYDPDKGTCIRMFAFAPPAEPG